MINTSTGKCFLNLTEKATNNLQTLDAPVFYTFYVSENKSTLVILAFGYIFISSVDFYFLVAV